MELQANLGSFTEYVPGEGRWVYRSFASEDFKCEIVRLRPIMGTSEQKYGIMIEGILPAHEMSVLCGKIQQITNGGRQ